MSLQLLGYFWLCFWGYFRIYFWGYFGIFWDIPALQFLWQHQWNKLSNIFNVFYFNIFTMEIWLIYQGLLNLEAKTSFTEFKRGALLSISSSSGYKTSFILKIFSSFQLKFPLWVSQCQHFEGRRSRSKIDLLLPQKSVLQKHICFIPSWWEDHSSEVRSLPR